MSISASAVRPPWRAIVVFVIVAMGLSWLVALPLWLGGRGLADPLLVLIAPAIMFTPALATIAALAVQRRAVGRRGARGILRRLGMWPLRPARRVVTWTVVVVFAVPLLVAAGLAVSALLGLVTLDLVEFSGFGDVLRSALPASAQLPPLGLLVALQLAMIPLGALINIPFAFGEEVGWRGWLLPALRPLGAWPALLISGAIWGLWHAPLILLGYNFAEPNLLGVALMIVACMLLGVLLGWTRLHTGSVWPAVLGHGAFNASAGMGALFLASGESPAPALVGPLGVVMWGVFAVVIVAVLLAGGFRATAVAGELAPAPASAPGSASSPAPAPHE